MANRTQNRNQVVDLFPFDKDEFITGLEQAISEVMQTKRILQESIDDIVDEVPEPPEVALDNIQKLLGRQTKIELILRGLKSLL